MVQSFKPVLRVAGLAAVVAWCAACPSPAGEVVGVELQGFIPFTRNCAPTVDLTRARTETGAYDIRAWAWGRYPYRAGLVTQNLLLPTPCTGTCCGVGNYREVTAIHVAWTPLAGRRRTAVASEIPAAVYLNPQQRFGGFFNAVDAVIAAGIDALYNDPVTGAPCDAALVRAGECLPADVVTPFRVTVALKIVGPGGVLADSNARSFTVNVCRDCLFQPPTQAQCCASPFKGRSYAAQQAYAEALSALNGRNVCNPFQDNDAMNPAWTTGGYYDVLQCDACRCADEPPDGYNDTRPFCAEGAAP